MMNNKLENSTFNGPSTRMNKTINFRGKKLKASDKSKYRHVSMISGKQEAV